MSSSRLLILFPHLRAFRLAAVHVATDGIALDLHPTRRAARCPLCHTRAIRVQSTYLRTIRDLTCGGLPLILHVRVRRFRCASDDCPRRIFAEQFPDLAAPRARLTNLLRGALQDVGLALGEVGDADDGQGRASTRPPDTAARVGPAARRRDRRLGMAARPSLRHHPLRLGAPSSGRVAAGSIGGDGR